MAVSVLSGCFWCGVPGSCGLVAERTRDKREGKIVSFRAGLCLLSWHRFGSFKKRRRKSFAWLLKVVRRIYLFFL